VESRKDFRRVRSRACFAAIRAFAACSAFTTIRFASPGCSSSHVASLSFTVVSTRDRIEVLPSLVLVCPSNCGSRSLTETMPIRPSRMSSPMRFSSFSFSRPLVRAYRLMTFVRAFLKPSSCIPPSWVLMVLAKEWIDSAYPVFHWSAISASASSSSASR